MRALLGLLVLFAAGQAHAGAWSWMYSPGMPAQAADFGRGGWKFEFPQYRGPIPCSNDQACASAHYLVTPTSRSLLGARSITADGRIGITGRPIFNFRTEPTNKGKAPAAMRFFIQQQGDDMTGRGKFEFYRWWSNPVSVKLQKGPFHASAPLRAGAWSSVMGKKGNASPAARAGFQATLAHPARVGVTFSGGDAFGHGVNVRGGRATMTVSKFHIGR